ncbi:MAG: hypothetical protein DRJ03_11090 [Chloroflexi bacterium]|nr:MAG: hypothetical protein DRJ03_11090 [Chloroflexota bacterium]
MVLANYVKLETGKEKVLRFRPDSARIEVRLITDPVTKKTKRVRALVIDVIEEDGLPVEKVFSTLSEKLAETLWTAHQTGDLYRFRVGITPVGEGYAREYKVRFF